MQLFFTKMHVKTHFEYMYRVFCLCLQPLHPAATCHEKVVSVQKDPSESLGMTVAGGASHREWDLPVYVISVEPGGVISRDGRIKTGKKCEN
jgi:hypothetical protein